MYPVQLISDKKRKEQQSEVKRTRVLYGIGGSVVVALFLCSLCLKTSEPGMLSPKETVCNLWIPLRLFLADLFDRPYALNRSELLASLPNYLITQTRLARTVIFALSGMGTALAGSIFQHVYKNPMATPGMIGATAGVNLGNVLMVTLYSGMALYLPLIRYGYCYLLTGIILCGVVLTARLSGGKKAAFTVVEMVMAGSVVSQMFQVVTTYLMYRLESDDLITYQLLVNGTTIQTDRISLLVFLGIMTLSLIPMILLRFRFNAAACSVDEAKTLGIHGVRLRLTGQICGALMVTASMIQCGDMGMISMAIPHLVRCVVGADFRKVSVLSMLYGAGLMLLCHMISSQIYIAGSELPVNFIISFCVMPVFFSVLAKQRRAFE